MVVSTSCEDATLTINTDRVITSLEANGFSKIVISSCPNLQTIILGSPEKLKSLSVNSCNTSNTFSLNSENIENLTNLSKLEEMFTFVITSNTSEKGVVNLSECVNLTSLSLNNTQSFYKVILPESGVKLGNNTFYNTSLRFLDGKAILNGTEIFKNTPVFQLR
jgi:hypothetical protein